MSAHWPLTNRTSNSPPSALTSAGDLEAVLRTLAQHLRAAVGTQTAEVYDYDESTHSCRLEGFDESADPEGARTRLRGFGDGRREGKDRVRHELAGTVVGDLAAALHAEDLDPALGQQRRELRVGQNPARRFYEARGVRRLCRVFSHSKSTGSPSNAMLAAT